jgi:1-acyl-sn-glycerol-3-phosphate acyltransferase
VLPETPQTPTLLGRETLVGAITAFLHRQPPRSLVVIRRALYEAIDDAGPDAMAQLKAQLATTGADWDYYPSNPLARRIHRVLADQLLDSRSTLIGLENVKKAAGKRVVIFANHLSYSDANLIEVLLSRGGASSLADRLTVVAGPKVYSSLQRRFSSLCFGTIKTPQSSARSSEDAVMNPREVARAARRTIEIANERLRLGETLLVFAEGSRSRTRGMQQMLAGVSRYLDEPDTWVLPMGITGSEELFPIGEDTIHPVPCVVRVGVPLSGDELRDTTEGNRQLMMDRVGEAIASLLPADYRGTYATAATQAGDR